MVDKITIKQYYIAIKQYNIIKKGVKRWIKQ